MKELAINSANDSNNDEDRRALQKEFSQRMETVDDIVNTTEYNGKLLLNGTWTDEGAKILQEINREIPIDRLVINFVGGDDTQAASSLQSSGNLNLWATTADVGFVGNSNYNHEAILDFSGVQRKYAYAYKLHNQGFTLLCGGCAQYVNIRFNANKTADQSTVNHTANTKNYNGTTYTNDMAGEFIICIKGVTNADELANAIFEGVKALQGSGVRRSYTATFNGYGNATDSRTISSSFINTDNEVLLDANHSLSIRRNSDGKIFIKQRGGNSLLFKAGLIPNDSIGDLADADFPDIIINPLWAQHGAESGQRFHIFINDLSTISLGLENTNVNTISDARSAIARCESAIDYALNEATNMGAYLQRLDASYLNITTSSENVQAAESTIRDADMAKEMTEFARYKILTSSSQAMVSQSNRNEQSVLGLIG